MTAHDDDDARWRASITRSFDQIEEAFAEQLRDLADDAGFVDIAKADALAAKFAAMFDRTCDRLIARIEKQLGPRAAEIMRAELLPLRELMRKRTADLLRPH